MNLRLDSLQSYHEAHQQSMSDPDGFWGTIADAFEWHTRPTSILSGDFSAGRVRWFDGGEVNITVNALDRHLANRGGDVAILWEPNEPEAAERRLTFAELHEAVCAFGASLRAVGIEKGDRVVLYMPMTPELAVAVLACARIGAVHSVVFAGFSAQALADRIQDAGAKLVITANEGRRGPKTIPLKSVVD